MQTGIPEHSVVAMARQFGRRLVVDELLRNGSQTCNSPSAPAPSMYSNTRHRSACLSLLALPRN